MTCRGILDSDEMVADAALMTQGAHRFGAVVEQRALERWVVPRLRHGARAGVRADLGLIGFDDEIECGRIDVSLLGQDRLKRAYAQLRLRELRAVLIVLVLGHGETYECIVPSDLRCSRRPAEHEVEGGCYGGNAPYDMRFRWLQRSSSTSRAASRSSPARRADSACALPRCWLGKVPRWRWW